MSFYLLEKLLIELLTRPFLQSFATRPADTVSLGKFLIFRAFQVTRPFLQSFPVTAAVGVFGYGFFAVHGFWQRNRGGPGDNASCIDEAAYSFDNVSHSAVDEHGSQDPWLFFAVAMPSYEPVDMEHHHNIVAPQSSEYLLVFLFYN